MWNLNTYMRKIKIYNKNNNIFNNNNPNGY